jgi:hypothetical protein
MRFERAEKVDKPVNLMDSLNDTIGWHVNKGKWDAIVFQPRHTVRIFGIGVFAQVDEFAASLFNIGYKYQIEDAKTGQPKKLSEEYVERNVKQKTKKEVFKHFFIH